MSSFDGREAGFSPGSAHISSLEVNLVFTFARL